MAGRRAGGAQRPTEVQRGGSPGKGPPQRMGSVLRCRKHVLCTGLFAKTLK